MRRKIVAGNWKMNLNNVEAAQLTSEIVNMVKDEVRNKSLVILAPPFLFLNQVRQLINTGQKNIMLAAQNCSTENNGAYTGEISASMLADSGCSFVIIGHSERRKYFKEKNEDLARKVDMVFHHNMEPIFCCGETMEERNSNNHIGVVRRQIEESLFHIPASVVSRVVIAYEPVWAIGTGLTASPAQAQEMHLVIRNLLERKYGGLAREISILYGGSCNEANAQSLFELPDIDGGLIGGASLKSRSFVNIIKSIN